MENGISAKGSSPAVPKDFFGEDQTGRNKRTNSYSRTEKSLWSLIVEPMPPKSFQRKRNKPLDRRELKCKCLDTRWQTFSLLNYLIAIVKKRKQELVHKATVKSRYYKSLKKEDPTLNTPDYVKEVRRKRSASIVQMLMLAFRFLSAQLMKMEIL